ncbi:hypothetical protein K2X89_14365 [Myxococcota bacterium]|nr:hypothetical protein [Myxococcota bacterium]
MLVATSDFEDLARRLAALEAFEPRMLVVEHPLGGIEPEVVAARARRVVEPLLGMLR